MSFFIGNNCFVFVFVYLSYKNKFDRLINLFKYINWLSDKMKRFDVMMIIIILGSKIYFLVSNVSDFFGFFF